MVPASHCPVRCHTLVEEPRPQQFQHTQRWPTESWKVGVRLPYAPHLTIESGETASRTSTSYYVE